MEINQEKKPYSGISHTHCWDNGDNPCGIAIEKHTQCCLCDTKVPTEGSKEGYPTFAEHCKKCTKPKLVPGATPEHPEAWCSCPTVEVCGRCNKPKKHENEKERCHCGRPIEYNYSYVQNTEKYIDECEDEEVQELTGVSAKGTELFKTKLKVKLPSIEGLSLFLKVAVSTIYEWEKEYPEFSEVISILRAKQANVLLNKGTSGDYNPTISKVLLTKHGYREGIEQSGPNGKDLFVDPEKKAKSDQAIDKFLATGK